MIKLFGSYSEYLNAPVAVVEAHTMVYLARLRAEKEHQEREEKKYEQKYREMQS